jgi:UDP-glucose 4-epimerase
MSILITGAAGFIGCRLSELFVRKGIKVVGIDNLCRGKIENLSAVLNHHLFRFNQIDLADIELFRNVLLTAYEDDPVTEVWHMAANSDIPAGVSDLRVDLKDTFMSTTNTILLMEEFGIPIISFASSSAIYGDLGKEKLVENTGPLFPISNYGAMKLASEAVISAATESFLKKAFIFRFPNVIGTPATHGVILDFLQKLKKSPENLVVLGDGTQQKIYLHVDELIEAMLFIRDKSSAKLNFFNIGGDDEGVTVRYIAEQVVAAVAPTASVTYGKGNKGWVGDVSKFRYSIDKLRELGWQPHLSSAETLQLALKQIVEQEMIK